MVGAVVILLSCGHRQEQQDRVTEETLYCWTCRCDVKIHAQHVQWRIKCLDCRYSRKFGAARLAANYGADAHSRKQPTHRIQVWEGSRLDGVRTPRLFQDSLPIRLDDAPF